MGIMIERNFIILPCAGSTNSLLKERVRLSGTAVYDVICAAKQTGGRGRNGRAFFSPPGGLYFSAAYPFAQTPARLPFITLLAGLAVCRALETRFGPVFSVKWPNDIRCGDKKLCGVLTELVSGKNGPTAVVGVGLNVTADEHSFPPELKGTATSLALQGFSLPEPAALARDIVFRLDAYVYGENALTGDVGAYVSQINERSCLNGKTVCVRACDTVYSGDVLGISPDGALRLKTENGTLDLTAGEVVYSI